MRYTNVLQVIMTGFYNRDGKACLRSEQNVYKGDLFIAPVLSVVEFKKTKLIMINFYLNSAYLYF